jgi:hypothetical protein
MPADRANVLFIGNSFTTKNDLPGLLREIARAGRGITVETGVISAGGASLRRHWNAGAGRAVTAGGWDYVVLQEQSTLPIKNARRFHENVREFVPAIEESGARLVLFMTWARKAEPENQSLLTASYNQIGEELGATVVPVGNAWQLLLDEYDTPDLFAADGSHPTLAGSYLAACTFYAALFQGDPAGIQIDVGDLSTAERKLLQGIASTACRQSI